MKDFIKNRLKSLLTESKTEECQYQVRDIGGTDVYYKKRKKDKHWHFIDKKEFDKNANKKNTIKFKNEDAD